MTTPTSYELTVTMAFSGATSCIDGTTAALRTTLQSSSNSALDCMDNNTCVLSDVRNILLQFESENTLTFLTNNSFCCNHS